MATFTFDNKSPVKDSFGANRSVERSGTVTASTDATNTVNLVRFQSGAKVNDFVVRASGIGATDLTMTVGYVYDDPSLTDDPDAFFTALTIGQTGGGTAVWPANSASLNTTGFEALGDGNFVVVTGGGAVDTAFTLTQRATLTYGDSE